MDPRLRKALWAAVLLGVIVLVAMSVRNAAFDLVLDARSEGVAFTLGGPVDLVAQRWQPGSFGSGGDPQIALAPEEIELNVDTSFVDFGPNLSVEAVGTVGAQGIQHLEVGGGCRVQVDPLLNAAVRLSVVNVPGMPGPPCIFRVSYWTISGKGSNPQPSLVVAEALPSLSQPASIAFRPKEPLRLRAILVGGVDFTTSERSGTPESALLSATLRFPQLENRRVELFTRDTLSVDGLVAHLDLTVGPDLESFVHGRAERAEINHRQVSPSELELAQNHPLFARVLAGLVAIIGVGASLYGLMKP